SAARACAVNEDEQRPSARGERFLWIDRRELELVAQRAAVEPRSRPCQLLRLIQPTEVLRRLTLQVHAEEVEHLDADTEQSAFGPRRHKRAPARNEIGQFPYLGRRIDVAGSR